MRKTVLSTLLTLGAAPVMAQTDSTDTGKLSISGYVDSYYLTAFNRPQSGNLLGVDQLAGRAFDRLVKAGTLPAEFSNCVRNLYDVTANYQVTSKFYLGLNAAYGRYDFRPGNATQEALYTDKFGSSNPTWGGVAVYSNYAFSDVVGLGARFEHFEDKYAVRYLQTVDNSITVTAPSTLASGKLLVKPEFRLDTSPANYYENSEGQGQTSQSTLGVAFKLLSTKRLATSKPTAAWLKLPLVAT